MRQGYSQDNSNFSVSTPLGKDKLLLKSFHGEEQLSGLFRFNLEMVASDANLDFTQLVGKSATVAVALADGSKRYFNGIVTRFVQGGSDATFTTYYAELSAWFWILTLTSDSRIFQNQSAPEIIEALFGEFGVGPHSNGLKATYEKREYCVQYQETAFAFISRLMEEEGIFYFFKHEDGKHTLMLADDADAHAACAGAAKVSYRRPIQDASASDVVSECALEQQMATGLYAASDFNFETPTTDIQVTLSGTASQMRVYEYPGLYAKKDRGDSLAKVRMEEFEAPTKLLRGNSSCRGFATGYKFELMGHDRQDMNSNYVLSQISHSLDNSGYSNSFTAFPLSVPFRPSRITPKSRIPGTQTAIVVGKSGEEIWTDQYGRVKVQFHWDQKGQNDENSSCWIRVAQGWAGKSWGAIFLPRIGQEVIVSFLEGDPDRPIITGSVYNAQQTVPYGLPGEQTKSTIKSNSSKGGGGFNEIRFEDKKDSEEFYAHAQKDMTIVVEHDRSTTVTNDDTLSVKQNRVMTVEEGNETLEVKKGDRTVKVDTGKETHEVKGERSLTVTGAETHTNKADFTQKVSGNFELKVDGDLTIDVSGSVTIKSGSSLTNKAGTALTNQAGTALENKAGTSLTNQAGTTLTNKASASQTVDGGGSLTLKGGMVQIN